MTLGTIMSHLEKLIETGTIDPEKELAYLERDEERHDEIMRAITVVQSTDKKVTLSAIKSILGDTYTFDEIRFARLFTQRS